VLLKQLRVSRLKTPCLSSPCDNRAELTNNPVVVMLTYQAGTIAVGTVSQSVKGLNPINLTG